MPPCEKNYITHHSRRKFIVATSAAVTAMALPAFAFNKETKVLVYAHLWVYASRYSPDWDCTPILDDLFSDLKYSDLEGVTDFRAIAKALKE